MRARKRVPVSPCFCLSRTHTDNVCTFHFARNLGGVPLKSVFRSPTAISLVIAPNPEGYHSERLLRAASFRKLPVRTCEAQSRDLLLNNYLPVWTPLWRLLVLFDSAHEETVASLLLTDGIFYRLNLQTNIFQRTLPNSMSCSVLIKTKHAASPLSHVY